jgi:hypothetical protein
MAEFEGGAPVVFLHVKTIDGTEHTIFPELVCKLASFALFRPRNVALGLVLRNLALDWVRSRDLSWVAAAPGLPSSIVIGAKVSTYEDAATLYGTDASFGCPALFAQPWK